MIFDSTYIDTELTDNLKSSFVNDYQFWKNIINNTNNAIKINNRNDDTNLVYSYDEFCKKFINHIENMYNGTIFKQEIIQDVLMVMINDKTN